MLNYTEGLEKVKELSQRVVDPKPFVISINGLPDSGKSVLRRDLCRHFTGLGNLTFSSTGGDSVIEEYLSQYKARIGYWIVEDVGIQEGVDLQIKRDFGKFPDLRVMMYGAWRKNVFRWVNDTARKCDVVILNEFASEKRLMESLDRQGIR